MGAERKIKIWVTGEAMEKNLIFNETSKNWIKTMNYINKSFQWQLIIIYCKSSNTEIIKYYNYENKKSFPSGIDDI